MLGTVSFVHTVEHSYTVRKSEKSLNMGEPTFQAKKTACYRLQQQTKVYVLALARQSTLENVLHKKRMESDNFNEHCIIGLLGARELVLLPLGNTGASSLMPSQI